MKKEKDELTELFQSRLGNAGMTVREDFWENLERDIPVVISRRRQFIHRFSAAASVLLVLAGASAAFWYFSPKEEIADAFTEIAVSTGTSGSINSDVVKEEFPSIHVTDATVKPAARKPVTAIEEHSEEESFSMSFSMSFSFSSSGNMASSDRSNTYNEQSAYTQVSDNESSTWSVDENVPVIPVTNHKQKTWSVGLFASAGLLDGQEYFPSDALTQSLNPESGLTVKHKRPFTAGISVRKALSDRFGIESGLAYTRLKSEGFSDNQYFTEERIYHYLGIPVKADYSLYKDKRVNLYASAGGMAEKCLSGNVKTNLYENGERIESVKHSDKTSRIQLSLAAAVGVEYKLSDRLALYAEPGLSYHFDDGSSLLTIRKETPLNLNLQCGVRMTY